MDKLIRDLDSDTFATREAASAELAAVADRVEPALKTALAAAPSAEAARRLRELLRAAAPERLRQARAVAALEYAGTPDAARALDDLAGGSEHDPLTREAAEARARLRRASK